MDIKSPNTCISVGDVIRIECEIASEKTGETKNRDQFYHVIYRGGTSDYNAFIAFRLRKTSDGEQFQLMTDHKTGEIMPVALVQKLRGDTPNTVMEKISSNKLVAGTHDAERRIMDKQTELREKIKGAVDSLGPRITTNRYDGAAMERYGDASRRWERAAELPGNLAAQSSPEGTISAATLGDMMDGGIDIPDSSDDQEADGPRLQG